MKVKNFVLFDNLFTEALMFFVKLHIPVKVSFPLEKCLKKFQEEEVAVRTARDNLVKKYGEIVVDKEGNPQAWDIAKASKENQDLFNKEIIELINMEFELPIDNRIEVSIKDLEKVNVSTEYLNKMSLLIDIKD